MWARIVSVVLGIWLMAAPSVLGHVGTPAEANDRIVGPLIVSFAFVGIWDITRGLRHLNTALGLWLVVSPFLLGAWLPDWSFPATVNSVLVGAYVFALSLVRGRISNRFGGGWRSLLQDAAPERRGQEWVAAEPDR